MSKSWYTLLSDGLSILSYSSRMKRTWLAKRIGVSNFVSGRDSSTELAYSDNIKWELSGAAVWVGQNY